MHFPVALGGPLQDNIQVGVEIVSSIGLDNLDLIVLEGIVKLL